MAQKKVKIKLQGHQKFALRDGWLNKGMIMVEKHPDVFLRKDAADMLGIGSNMVNSLRYWLNAFNLIEEKGREGTKLTNIAQIIAKYDKYFEDIFTIWMLHSNIAKNVKEATTWYMFFNCCDLDEFDKEEIIVCLTREILKYTNGEPFSEQSLKNDLDVLLNMYGKGKGMIDPEDKSISPMVQLELIKKSESVYLKNHPDRRKINEWNILYELASIMKDEKSVSIDSITIGERSISAIYQITRVTINELLDILDNTGYIHVDRTAGLDMIYKEKEFSIEEIAEMYYKTHR